MSRVKKLSQAVEDLDREEFAIFAAWFEAFERRRWDRQIEADATAGKVNGLAEQALADLRSGKITPL
jgi:hypothetical protein